MVVIRCEVGTEATKALCLAMRDLLRTLVKQAILLGEKIPTNVKAQFSEHTLVPEGWRGPGGSLPASVQTVAQLK